MADVKISALPLATTPLAGTEVLPIVQSATTDQVSVANLTAGRSVSAASLTLTTTPLAVGSGGTGLTSLTAGYIPYGNGTSAFGSSSNLSWDSANTRFVVGSSTNNMVVRFFGTSYGVTFNSDASSGFRIEATDPTGFGSYQPLAVNGSILSLQTGGSERMRLDASGNLGLGVTPSAWTTGKAIEVGNLGNAIWGVGASNCVLTSNVYYNSSAYKYANTGAASQYQQVSGAHQWYSASSGSQNATITGFSSPTMTLDASGQLSIGTTAGSAPVTVQANSGANVLHGIGRSSGGYCGLNFYNNANSTQNGYILFGDSDAEYRVRSYLQFTVASGATNAMRIDSSGNVGIGTASPSYPLDVYNAANGIIRVKGGSATNQGGAFFVGFAGSTNTLAGFGDSARFVGGTPDASVMVFAGAVPLTFYANGGERARIDANGNIICGTAAIATNATNGFLYVPGCAGTPTGTPTTVTGRSPIVVDTTNNKLYFYSGGQWRDAGP